MRKLVLLGLLLVCAPAYALDNAALVQAWGVFTESGVEEPDGAMYMGFVLGVLQGSYQNSTVFDHIPSEISVVEMCYIVGRYIDKHKDDEGFKDIPASIVVTKAILARWPDPKPLGNNL